MCFIFIFCFKFFFFFNAIVHSSITIYFFFQFVPIVGSLACFFSLSLSLCTYFFFNLLSSMRFQREREEKEERERAREIHRIHYEFRTVSRGRIVYSMFVFCMYVCICIYIYTRIYIYIFNFSVRYIISVIFVHARDIFVFVKNSFYPPWRTSR